MARDKISHIRGRISYDELASAAKSELLSAIEEVVKANESRFVDFFNNSQPITPRMHSLELIPGIGKKFMWVIVRQRERGRFSSLKDLQERTGLPDPSKLVAKRVLEELTREPKYRLFTRPM